ncbi:hypothetical protein [Pseudobacteriovorax antillogorgiicola]|uniref:Heme oxygenase n=1 Tax=Pseudobacteriovorax antillogorgiicola TaxID=1513793 RepID=A0A1Y6BFU0_9BACT|nr:hypothetical protein [Pseudobacteriovorax antillogorgiicola]TCS57345.1 heme oxygenase [Pseudobacteriovorax antillogorgiicola]SMF02194.1 Heme oxygenase [Pseudobacteriovorax antillogorgiicola]
MGLIDEQLDKSTLTLLREKTRYDHDKVDRHPFIVKLMKGEANEAELIGFSNRQASWLKSNYEFLNQYCQAFLKGSSYDIAARVDWLLEHEAAPSHLVLQPHVSRPGIVALVYVSEGSLKGLQMTTRLFKRLYPGFVPPLTQSPARLSGWWQEASVFINGWQLTPSEIELAIYHAKQCFSSAKEYLVEDG